MYSCFQTVLCLNRFLYVGNNNTALVMSKNQVDLNARDPKVTSKQNCKNELNQAITRPPTECVPMQARQNDEIYLSLTIDEGEQKYDKICTQTNLAYIDKNNGKNVSYEQLLSAKEAITVQTQPIKTQNDVNRSKDLVKDRVKEIIPNYYNRCTRTNEVISGKAYRPRCAEPTVENHVIADSDDYQTLNFGSVSDISLYDVISSSNDDESKVAKSSDLVPRQPNIPTKASKEANLQRRPLMREQVCSLK